MRYYVKSFLSLLYFATFYLNKKNHVHASPEGPLVKWVWWLAPGSGIHETPFNTYPLGQMHWEEE